MSGDKHFTWADWGNYVPDPVPPHDKAAALEEMREVVDYVERSRMFDSILGIERVDFRDQILWAARRNLRGVLLPTREQLHAMQAASGKEGAS